MMKITQIKSARHRQTAVYLDEVRHLIDTETFLLSGYREGDDISETQWEELLVNSQNNRAYEKGLYLLDYRAHSRGELVTKISREYPKWAVEYAIERIEALGLIDDLDFATRLAEELTTQRGYGKARVKADLQKRGISREIMEQVLQGLPENQEETCKLWIQKKYKTLPTDYKEQTKIIGAAVRRGFDYSTAKQAVKDCLEQQGIEEGEESLWQYE